MQSEWEAGKEPVPRGQPGGAPESRQGRPSCWYPDVSQQTPQLSDVSPRVSLRFQVQVWGFI